MLLFEPTLRSTLNKLTKGEENDEEENAENDDEVKPLQVQLTTIFLL